eukprot:364974-Chlamydomonas_euryale.AAC.1
MLAPHHPRKGCMRHGPPTARRRMVPAGTGMTKSSALAPCIEEPSPLVPFGARQCTRRRKPVRLLHDTSTCAGQEGMGGGAAGGHGGGAAGGHGGGAAGGHGGGAAGGHGGGAAAGALGEKQWRRGTRV